MPKKLITDQNIRRLEYLSIFLRELRLNEGLTQEELSQQMNLHRNSIIRAENAKNITLLSLFELADALDMSPNEIFREIE
jgi:transcriptional regulator with XRE-family HTH domain